MQTGWVNKGSGFFFGYIPLILFLILTLLACDQPGPQSGHAERGPLVLPVQIGRVEFRDVTDEVRSVGNLVARRRIMVNAEVEGAISEVRVREGTRVRQGDLMMRIDPREYQLRKEQLQADKIQAEEEHEKAVRGLRPEEKDRLQAQVEADISSLELSRREEKRMHQLLQEGVVSQTDYDAAEDRANQAEEGLRASQAALSAATRSRDEDIRNTRAQLEAVIRKLELSELDLEKTAVTSPFDGVVLRRQTELGAYVKEGDALVDMIDSSALKAEVELPQAYRDRMDRLQEIELVVPELNHRFKLTRGFNRKVRVITDGNVYSGNFKIQIDLDSPPEKLFPGLTLEAYLRFGKRTHVAHVPEISLVEGKGDMSVYVVDKGKAQRIPVIAGNYREGLVEVEDPTRRLSPESQLILRGSGAVFPGASVKPTNTLVEGQPKGPKGPPGAGKPGKGKA